MCAKKIFFQLFLCAGADWVCVAHDEPETTHNFQKWGERERRRKRKSLLSLLLLNSLVLLWNIRKTLFGSDNFFVLGSSQPLLQKKIKCERTDNEVEREKNILNSPLRDLFFIIIMIIFFYFRKLLSFLWRPFWIIFSRDLK